MRRPPGPRCLERSERPGLGLHGRQLMVRGAGCTVRAARGGPRRLQRGTNLARRRPSSGGRHSRPGSAPRSRSSAPPTRTNGLVRSRWRGRSGIARARRRSCGSRGRPRSRGATLWRASRSWSPRRRSRRSSVPGRTSRGSCAAGARLCWAWTVETRPSRCSAARSLSSRRWGWSARPV